MKKYFLTIAAIFKNEAPFFKEWLEYHHMVGVEHFYLYNNGSTDNFQEVLSPYIKNRMVTLIDWPDRPGKLPENAKYRWVHNIQLPAYEHAIQLSMKETKWLALIDIDEFIVPKLSDTITPLLEQYEEFPAIRLYWHVYGTSGVQELHPNQLVIETFHKTCLPDEDFNTKFFKTILRPEEYIQFHWPPHIAMYRNDEPDIVVNKFEAQINHYINRSVKFFYDTKLKTRQGALNEGMTESDIQYFLSVGNAMEDEERAIMRFIPRLQTKMHARES